MPCSHQKATNQTELKALSDKLINIENAVEALKNNNARISTVDNNSQQNQVVNTQPTNSKQLAKTSSTDDLPNLATSTAKQYVQITDEQQKRLQQQAVLRDLSQKLELLALDSLTN